MAAMFIAVICVVILIGLLSAALDSNRFVTRTYEIRSEKVLKPCRLVLLADLHNKSFGRENERLLSAIEEIAPDAVLAAGDMLTAKRGADFGNALALMERLAARFPVYYGMGNHEYRLGLYPEKYPGMYESYMEGLKKAGIEPLINESAYLPAWNITVCGAQIDRDYYRHFRRAPMEPAYLTKILGTPERETFQLLIAHNPVYFDAYAEWGADLVVAGHVHGGIMRLPILGGVLSPSLTLFPKYDGGIFREHGSTMILSRGLSSHTIPIRIFNPGELIVITLEPDK
ncbi:MAG: metallophosphoesterase [Bacteroidales bacterium]|nr:metallophosphoesterase [Bacteroidales bacterium]MCM1414322.1 metallophosphoesterase [bacterium]MCM1422202.1 metallophosphoesterase [bacterium]